jgi:hypothetical protein
MVVDGFAPQTSKVNKFPYRTNLVNYATITRYLAIWRTLQGGEAHYKIKKNKAGGWKSAGL